MLQTVEEIISTLALEPHVEGGYFKRTYTSSIELATKEGVRQTLSSIYYLLSAQARIGHWHKNRSDIMHYFHAGSALTYYLISPEGELTTSILSNDLTVGQPQLLVPGGYWKATVLEQGQYGLLSEAVTPSFDFEDMDLACAEELSALFPQHHALIQRLSLS